MGAHTGRKDVAAGVYLRRLRLSEGLSPEQLGMQCGVAGKTIRSCEERGTIPHVYNQLKLARYFEKSPSDIWTLRRINRPKAVANAG